VGRNGYVHHEGGRGRGPGISGKMGRDKVGKVLTATPWARSPRQRPANEPEGEGSGRLQDRHMRS
jgi:hypothetical protein